MKLQHQSNAEPTHRFAKPPSWSRYWLTKIAGQWQSVLVLSVCFLLFGMSIWPIWRYAFSKSASVVSPLLRDSGVVVNKEIGIHHNSWESPKRNGSVPMGYSVQFRVGERLLWGVTSDKRQWDHTEIGSKVPVSYRAGKDNDIFIEKWEPVPDYPVVKLNP